MQVPTTTTSAHHHQRRYTTRAAVVRLSICLQSPRAFCGMAAVAGTLYVCGGVASMRVGDRTAQWNTGLVEQYNLESSNWAAGPQWCAGPSMIHARMSPAGTPLRTHHSTMYTAHTALCTQHCPHSTAQWCTSECECAVVAWDGKVVAVGGVGADDEPLNTVEVGTLRGIQLYFLVELCARRWTLQRPSGLCCLPSLGRGLLVPPWSLLDKSL